MLEVLSAAGCPQLADGHCLVAGSIYGEPCPVADVSCQNCGKRATIENPTAQAVGLAIWKAIVDQDKTKELAIRERFAELLTAPATPAVESPFDCIHRSAPKATHVCETCWAGKGRRVDVFDCAKFGKRCTIFSDYETGLKCAECKERTSPAISVEACRSARCSYLEQPEAWAGRYQGATCFLVCGGPSLETMDWSIFPKRGPVVFAINNAGAGGPAPHLWVGTDEAGRFSPVIWRDASVAKFVSGGRLNEPFRDRLGDEWRTTMVSAGTMANVHRITKHGGAFDVGSFFTSASLQSGKGLEYEGEEFKIHHRSTMFWALRMAVDFGFKTINLVGCDFTMTDAKPYGWDEKRSRPIARGNNATMRYLQQALASLAPVFQTLGVDVWNCTPGGKLDAFPRRSFEAACREATLADPGTLAGLYDWWLPKIAGITIASDQAQQLARCDGFVRRQSRPLTTWVIADRGETPATSRSGDVFRIPGADQSRALAAAIEKAVSDPKITHVAFFDAGDWYGPDWIREAENIVGAGVELFGEQRRREYDPAAKRWRDRVTPEYSRPSQTVMSVRAAREFAIFLQHHGDEAPAIFWKSFQGRKRLVEGNGQHLAIVSGESDDAWNQDAEGMFGATVGHDVAALFR